MTPPIRPADESERLRIVQLERRVLALERAGAGLVHITAPHTNDVTITATTAGTAQDMTAAVALTKPGLYFVAGSWDMDWTVASAGTIAIGHVAVTGGVAIEFARVPLLSCQAAATRATIAQFYKLTVTSAGTVQAKAYKSAAAGTLICRGQSSGTGSGVLVVMSTGPV